MRRSLFLESENATKVDNVYTFDFKRPHDSYVNGFEIRNCVVNYSPTKTEVVTRAEINSLSLCAFFDYTDSTKITESVDYVTQINSQNSGDVVWTFSSNTSHQLIDIGSGKGIRAVANWHWGGDGSPGEKPGNNQDKSHLAMVIIRTGTADRRIFDDDAFYKDLFINGTGGVRFDAAVDVVLNVSLTKDVPYILSLTKDGDDFTCRAEQLTSPYTTQEDTQARTDTVWGDVNNKQHKISWGDAQYGNLGFDFGSWAIVKGDDSTDIALIHKFLRQQFTSEGELVAADIPITLQLNSNYLASRRVGETLEEVDGKHSDCIEHVNYFKKINDDGQYYHLSVTPRGYETEKMKLGKIDFYFENQGTKVGVNRFSIGLELYQTTYN